MFGFMLLLAWRSSDAHLIAIVVIWNIVCVTFDVSFHLFFVLKRLITNCALVALRSVVLNAVKLQHVIVAKVTKANVAMIRFLTYFVGK